VRFRRTALALLLVAEGAHAADSGRRGAPWEPWSVAQTGQPAGPPDQASGSAAAPADAPPSQAQPPQPAASDAQPPQPAASEAQPPQPAAAEPAPQPAPSGAARPRDAPAPATAEAPPSPRADAPAASPPAQGAPPPQASQERPRAPEAPSAEAPPRKAPPSKASGRAPPATGPNISGADISHTKISGADISGTTISGGTITGGTITGGTISGSEIKDSTISGAAEAPSGKAGDRRPAAKGRDHRAERARRPEGAASEKAEPDRSAGSGGGDDDEEAAARALQRSLVQRGALLLPVWGGEIVPGFTYGHTSQDTVTTIVPKPGAAPTTISVRRRTHQLTSSLTARLGLPWELQIEGSMPFAGAWSDQALAGAARDDAKGMGVGDPRFTMTRQLLRAHGMVPDLLVSGTWKPQVGRSPYDAEPGQVGLGTGYPSVGGTLTASKAADPLVFIGSASYTANLSTRTKAGWRDPGDTFALGGGAILAVSPDTSMSFLLDFHVKPEDHLGGNGLIGTDETVAVLQLGIATVLSRRALLNVTVGIGLTSDSPNFQLGFTVPVRF
jgi:hypothetical protein